MSEPSLKESPTSTPNSSFDAFESFTTANTLPTTASEDSDESQSDRSPSPRNRVQPLPGLVNLANTCYLNSVIQSLLSCRRQITVFFSLFNEIIRDLEMKAKERSRITVADRLTATSNQNKSIDRENK